MRHTAVAALCLAAVATAGLTGCAGGDEAGNTSREPGAQSTAKKPETTEKQKPKEPFAGLTGGEIAERALEATTGAASLRMKGDIPDEESGGTIHLDMALDKKGDCAGTMGLGDQGEAELVKTGDTLYMKYDEAFLRAQSEGEPKADVDATVTLLAGKWTKTSAKGADAEDIAGFCDLDLVLGGARDGDSDAARGKTTTVGGTPAIVLRERDGKDRYTLYVATEGEPYVLRVDSASAADPGSVTFTDYGRPVPAGKPSGDVLDLDSLG
ncbi:hypothetical protein ACPF8X_12055 [Streptomyces sp. G35A]